MALKRAPNAHETTQTTGTGDYTMDGPSAERAPFDQDMDTGDTVFYQARGDGNNWEIGKGTFTAPNIMARTQIIQSAAGGVVGTTAINWAVGVKDIYSIPDIELLGTSDFLRAANNLSDVQDASVSRNNIGVGDDDVVFKAVANQTIQPAAGSTVLQLFTATASEFAGLRIGESATGPWGQLQWRGPGNLLRINFNDGVSTTELVTFNSSGLTVESGINVVLGKDATAPLQAVTRQQMDAGDANTLKDNRNDQTITGPTNSVLRTRTPTTTGGVAEFRVGQSGSDEGIFRWDAAANQAQLIKNVAGVLKVHAILRNTALELGSPDINVNVDSRLNFTGTGRMVLPVGVDKWAT